MTATAGPRAPSLWAAMEGAVERLLADLLAARPAGAVVASPSGHQVRLRFPTVPPIDAEYMVVRPAPGESPETIGAVRITDIAGDRIQGAVLWSAGDFRVGDEVMWPERIGIVLLPTEADAAPDLSSHARRLDAWLELQFLTERRVRVLRAEGAEGERWRAQRLREDREYGLIVAPLLAAAPDGVEVVLRVRSIYTQQTLARRRALWARSEGSEPPPRTTAPAPRPSAPTYGAAIRRRPAAPAIERAATTSDHLRASVPRPIYALTLGDVDGDGRLEAIGISDRQVIVYAWRGGELAVRAASDPLPVFTTYLHVDTVDLDGDGRDEIVATAIRSVPRDDQIDNAVLGAVLRIRDDHLESLVARVERHLRVLRAPGEPPQVLAQRLGRWTVTDGPVQILQWSAGRYRLSLRAPFPDVAASLYGSAIADVNGDGRPELAVVAADGRLRLYDEEGRLQGTSDEDLGDVGAAGFAQTPRYPDYRGRSFDANAELLARWRPLPRRVVVTAVPGGGLELVTLSNPRSVGLRLAGAPSAPGRGRVVGYGWDAEARRLARRWESAELRGRALDLAIGDLPGDGRLRLVALSGDGEQRFVDIFALAARSTEGR